METTTDPTSEAADGTTQYTPGRDAGKHEVGSTGARFQDLLERTLEEIGQSPVRAAIKRGLNRDAFRSVMRGRAPSIDRADEICHALGIEFRLGEEPARPWCPSRPTPGRLPVRTLAGTPDNILLGGWSGETQAAPEGFEDPAGFYIQAPDDGLAPAGIRRNDLAIVSPNKTPRAGDLAWLIDATTGEELLGLVVRATADGYDVVRWIRNHKKQDFIPAASTVARGDRGRIVDIRPAC